MDFVQEYADWFMHEGWIWLRAALIFAFTFVGLAVLRRGLWKRLSSWVSNTAITWDDELLAAIESPARVSVGLVALMVSLQWMPKEVRSHSVAFYGARILVVLLGFWITDRVMGVLVRRQRVYPNLNQSGRTLVITILRVALFSLALLMSLDTLGVKITPILASLGIGSIAVALALQETLSNFFSGVYLLIDQPIRLGDFVQTESGVEGHVKKIGWRSTHIQLLSNNTVVIPNSKLSGSRITNFNLPSPETSFGVALGVAYGSDLAKVERVTVEVAEEVMRSVPGGVPSFKPSIRFTGFGDSALQLNVNLRAAQFVDHYLLKHEFIRRLHDRFQAEEIEIPFPQHVVRMERVPALES